MQPAATTTHEALNIARARWLLDRLHIIYLGGGAMAAGLTIGLLMIAPTWTVWAWGAVALAYFLGCRRLNAQARSHAIETHAQAVRWHRYAIAASVFQGLKWGTAAWMFLDTTSPAQALLVLGVVVSVVAGAMLVMASHPRCYACLSILVMVPLLLRLLDTGTTHAVLVVLLASSALMGIYLVFDTYKGLSDSLLTQIEHRQLAGRLADALQKAESAVQSRDELLAFAGHDLRAPITALELLASDLTRQAPPLGSEALAHKHRHIRDELRELSSLLDTLLDLGDDSTISATPQTIALGPVLEAAVARFNPLARVHNVDLRHCQTRYTACIDPVDLRRMLDNVITNAVRHTRGGRVVLLARRDGNAVRIEVRDSGSGMAASQQHAAFLPRTRLDNDADPLLARKGLGLAIVQQIAQRSGAQLQLRSAPGRGTVIGLIVPAGNPRRLSLEPRSEKPGRLSA